MQIGYHLVVRKPVLFKHAFAYTHHGIYVGGKTVIHYAGYANGLSSGQHDKSVSLISLDEFSDGQPVEVRQQPRIYSPQAIVDRARSRLGENKYSLLWRNCEHFATWCCTGKPQSTQVRQVIGTTCLLLVSLAARKGLLTRPG